MTTTTSISLELDDNLPDADAVKRLELRFRAYCARDLDRDLDTDLLSGWGGTFDVNDTGLTFQANTKWTLENAANVARSLSGAYPNADVSYVNEWDDDVPGAERFTYRAGRLTAAYDMQLVPTNLHTLVAALASSVKVLRAASEGDSNDAEIEAALALADDVDALTAAYYAGSGR